MRKKFLSSVLMITTAIAMTMAVNAEEDQYVYTTLNIPYADYYYGELNDVEPEAPGTATEGQYTAEDAVTAAGYREEGIYDAVTSATNQKSTRFAGSYTEENGEGVNILGPSHVNVAISGSLYESARQAIENGTECSNQLLNFVGQMEEVSEEAPVEYKVLNSDGVFSKTVGNQSVSDDASAVITTVSPWGNYQISVEGVELDINAIQGAVLETSDGARYGLEHEDNLWLQPAELAFAVEAFLEPHGNEVAYQRFSDIQGKTIVKITYLLADMDDIVIETDLLCKRLLSEEEGLAAPESVAYSTDGTAVELQMNAPEGTAYALSGVEGTGILDAESYTLDGNTLILSSDCKPGYYTIIYSDENYADAQADVLVKSSLEDGSVSIENNKIAVADNEEGITAADVAANITSVILNGEPVSGKNVGALLFDEEGNVNLDAELADREGNTTPLFQEAGEYTLEVTFDGYPNAAGTVTK